jgi:F-type H+-transporting ATPase subunit b
MALQALVLAAEAAEGEAAPNPLLPEPVELIVGIIAFAIVFFVLARFAFPPLNRMLEQRTDKIQGELERAEQARAESDRVLAEYRQKLGEARDEADRIIEEARRTADQLRRDLQGKAEQEAQGIVARAQEEIRAERDRVLQELKGTVGEIAVELAGRVVGQSLDKAAHERLIEDYIAQVSRQGDGSAN